MSIAYDDMDSIFDLSRYATEGLRITLIDPVGAVLYESGEDADAMVNQSELPEVRSALETGVGQSMRPAEDTDENKYYYAMRLRDGNILLESCCPFQAREHTTARDGCLWTWHRHSAVWKAA